MLFQYILGELGIEALVYAQNPPFVCSLLYLSIYLGTSHVVATFDDQSRRRPVIRQVETRDWPFGTL